MSAATGLASCLYVGRVRHRRFGEVRHEFDSSLFLLSVDLSELDRIFRGRWFWSVGRRNVMSLREEDYLGARPGGLDTAVRDLVEDRTGRRPAGPIRMVTAPRTWGVAFNPVTFFYCLDASGDRVETVVAEITNTPWKERHCYVLDRATDEGRGRLHRYRFGKDFHISPFLDMDVSYDWRFVEPGRQLVTHMDVLREAAVAFDATLVMERRELTGRNLAAALLSHPFLTGKMIAGIYWQALRLRLKGARFFAHPDQRSPEKEEDNLLAAAGSTSS